MKRTPAEMKGIPVPHPHYTDKNGINNILIKAKNL